MSIFDPEQIRVQDIDTAMTNYTAGEEPWNKSLDNFNIEAKDTDTVSYQTDFKKWHGIYRNIPEAKTAFDTATDWIIGPKLILNAKTKTMTDRIRGNGKSNFRRILWNLKLTSKFCGDAYAEIVRDKAKRIINLIPRNPGHIQIHYNNSGQIIRYDQVAMTGAQASANPGVSNGTIATWKPEEMFHVINNAVADEIHGVPVTESMIALIKSRHQIQQAFAVTLFRYMKPTYFFETTTDDETEMAEITTIIDKAMKDFTNVVLPKGTLDEIKQVRTAQFAILDPIPWMTFLKKYFTQVIRVPDVVLGESRESAISSGELNYIGFKEFTKFEQETYHEDIGNQLKLDVGFPEAPKIAMEVTSEEGTFRNDRDGTRTIKKEGDKK